MDNLNYDTNLRKIGYVSTGLGGSRGDYFISSYRPSAKHQFKLPQGRVEVHSCPSMRLFKITSPVGTFTGSKALEKLINIL